MKTLGLLLLALAMINLQACGTILKPNQINKPHSDKLDTSMVVLDSLGLLLFLIPGVVALTIDYNNGTLFMPDYQTIKLASLEPKSIQKVLLDRGISVSLQQLQQAELQAKIKTQ